MPRWPIRFSQSKELYQNFLLESKAGSGCHNAPIVVRLSKVSTNTDAVVSTILHMLLGRTLSPLPSGVIPSARKKAQPTLRTSDTLNTRKHEEESHHESGHA
jgi:hypothetical protein